MKCNKKAVALALVMTISMTVAAFAQTAFEQEVDRAIAQAQQKQQQQNAVVNVSVYWTDANLNQADQYIKKQCKGVLAQDGQVLFPAVCLKNASRSLKEVGFTFANGKIQPVAVNEITTNGDMALVTANPQAVQDLQGLPVQALPEGRLMRAFFKQFLLNKGVLPAQYRDSDHAFAGAYAYREASIHVGEPVIYEGKVIALVKEVPHVVYAKAENYFAWLQ